MAEKLHISGRKTRDFKDNKAYTNKNLYYNLISLISPQIYQPNTYYFKLLIICWRRQWQLTPVLLPGEFHGQRSLVGGCLWVTKSRTQLSDFTFTFHFHALEKEMATHSSVLAWRIPGTGEPGGLPFMASHRVGHD